MISYILMAITIAASFYTWKNTHLFGVLMMNPYHIAQKKQYYRFITSGFIHKDHMHLLLNMFSFYFFGLVVEKIFNQTFGPVMGGVYFVGLYLLAIIVSDLPTYLKQKNNPRYNSLGASGAVSAVIGGYIILRPLNEICIYFALCLPGFIMGVLYIGFSYYQGKKGKDNINHDAHLYGALFGILYCIIIYPSALSQFVQQIQSWDFFEKYF
jgi:membrane associated rhomboid family serine protease